MRTPAPTRAEITAAVQTAITTYGDARDAGHVRDVVATFTPSGILEIPALGALAEGHDALTQNYSQYVAAGPSRHLFSNILISDWNDQQITASCDVVVVRKGTSEWGIGMVGRYSDMLQKVDGSWLFARRTLTFARSEKSAGSQIDHVQGPEE